MAEAANPDIASYPTFNEFFTRAQARRTPFAEAPWLCPVDGAISQFGAIERDQVCCRPRATATRPPHWSAAMRALARVRERPVRHALPEPARLPPHPHALRRPAHAHDPRAGRAVLRQPDHGARRAGACSHATSGWSAYSSRSAALRADPGGRHHRRQHGHGLAWRGQPAAAGHAARMELPRAWRGRGVAARGAEMGRFPLGSTVVLFPKNTLRFNPEWRRAAPSAWARRWGWRRPETGSAAQAEQLPRFRRARDVAANAARALASASISAAVTRRAFAAGRRTSSRPVRSMPPSSAVRWCTGQISARPISVSARRCRASTSAAAAPAGRRRRACPRPRPSRS